MLKASFNDILVKMSLCCLNFLLLVALCISCQGIWTYASSVNTESSLKEMAKAGEEQYRLASQRAAAPKFGQCWKDAVTALENGCKNLDDKTQAELALRFSDCFLEMSGYDQHGCHGGDKTCMRNMPSVAFDTYSKFYVHTQSMCYFLQSELWHEETEKTITRLSDVSSKVSVQLAESAEVQGRLLSDVAAVGSAVAAVRAFLVGGSSLLGSLAFFMLSIALVALLTWPRSTARARARVVTVLSGAAAAEMIVAYLLREDEEALSRWIWQLRCVAVALCFMMLLYAAWTFRSYGAANNALLLNLVNKVDNITDWMNKFQEKSGSKECQRCTQLDRVNFRMESDHQINGRFLEKADAIKSRFTSLYTNREREATPSEAFMYPWTPSEVSRNRTSGSPRASPRPVSRNEGEAEVTREASPPPPYSADNSAYDVNTRDEKELTRRDFYTPDRETSAPKTKDAVIRVVPLSREAIDLHRPSSRSSTPNQAPRGRREGSRGRSTPTRVASARAFQQIRGKK